MRLPLSTPQACVPCLRWSSDRGRRWRGQAPEGRIAMRLFGKKKADQPTPTSERPTCLHIALTARWDSVEDMGNEDKATSYVCLTCNAEFTPAEASEVRSS